MASLLILQTATDHGLASCFIGIPPAKEAAVRAAFEIPDDFDPVGVVTIGHHAADEGAAGSPSRRAPQARWRTSCIAGAGVTGPVHRREPRAVNAPHPPAVSHPRPRSVP